MQHIPSSEPAIPSVSQGNPGTSRNQEIHHRVQNSQKLVSIRAKFIRVKTSDICWSSILVLFFHLHLRLTSGLQPSKFPNLNALCISLLLVCSTRFPLLFFLQLINFWSAAKIMKIIIKQIFPSSCHFLVLDQNIFLITPLQNTFSLYSSVNTEGQVSHPYVTSGAIEFPSLKGNSNIMFKPAICWQKTKLMYKNPKFQIVIKHSVCLLYLIHHSYDTFLTF